MPNVRISDLPETLSLTGSEYVEVSQGGLSRKARSDLFAAIVVPSNGSSIILQNTNNPDLVDTDVGLNVGAVNPDTAAHVEVGRSAIQAKADATTQAALTINSLGGNLLLGPQSGTGLVRLYNSGVQRLVVEGGGTVSLRSDGDTDAEDRLLTFDFQNGTNRAAIGFAGDDTLFMRNFSAVGLLQLRGTNAGSQNRLFFQGDPDGQVGIWHPGSDTQTVRTVDIGTGGLEILQSVTATGWERVMTESDLAAASLLPPGNLGELPYISTAPLTYSASTGMTWDSATQTLEAPGLIAGDPGVEGTGILINGILYNSALKASAIGGPDIAQFIIHRHDDSFQPLLVAARAKGNTSGHIIVNDGDFLFTMLATGWDGASYAIAGDIEFRVDGPPGLDDMPGLIAFSTTAPGAENATERVRIRSSGLMENDFAMDFAERADHIGAVPAGRGQLWVRNDTPNVLVFTDDAGTDTVLGAGGGGVPGGADTQVQYNDSGTFNGDADFTWDDTAKALALANTSVATNPVLSISSNQTLNLIQLNVNGLNTSGIAYRTTVNSAYAIWTARDSAGANGFNLSFDPTLSAANHRIELESQLSGTLQQWEADGAIRFNVYAGSPLVIDAATSITSDFPTQTFEDGSGNAMFILDQLGPTGSSRAQFDVPVAIQLGSTARASLYIEEQAAAVDDFAGFGQLWVRDDSPNVLVFTDDTGVDTVLGAGGGTPGGANTNVQYNDSGSFGGSANFTWDNAAEVMQIAGSVPRFRIENDSDFTETQVYWENPSTGMAIFVAGSFGDGVEFVQTDGSQTNEGLFMKFYRNLGVEVYHNNILRWETGPSGEVYHYQNGNGNPTTPTNFTGEYLFYSQDLNEFGGIGYNGSPTLRVFNRAHGAAVQLNGEDAGGNARVMVECDPDSSVTLRYPGANLIRALTEANGTFDIRGDLNNDTDFRLVTFSHQDGTRRALIGHNNTTRFDIISEVNGANVLIGGNDAGGTLRTILTADPDSATTLRGDTDVQIQVVAGTEQAILCTANAGVDLYYDGVRNAGTRAPGVFSIDSVGNTDAENRILRFAYQNFTNRGQVGFQGSDVFRVSNLVHGGNVDINGEDISGFTRQFLLGDPDGLTTITGDTGVTITTTQAGSVLIQTGGATRYQIDGVTGRHVFNDYGVFLEERASASADSAGYGQIWVQTDAPNRLKFTDDTGQDYDVAMVGGFVNDNVFLNSSRNYNTAGNFAANNILYYADGSNNTVTLENSSATTNWPVYTSITIIAPGSGVQTIAEGTGVTLFDDSGTDLVGGCTVSGGAVTIFRASTTDYIIFGSGITP